MANWAWNDVYVVGSEESIKKLYDTMKKVEEEHHGDDGWIGTWLGYLTTALGLPEDDKELYRRGDFNHIELINEKTLQFESEFAWGACTDVLKFLEQKIPDIKCYFFCEGFDDCIYASNDIHHKFFKDRYYICNDYFGGEFFETLREVIKYINDCIDILNCKEDALEGKVKKIKKYKGHSYKSLVKFINRFEEKYEDTDPFGIYKVAYEDF